jgi:hypothetical protein
VLFIPSIPVNSDNIVSTGMERVFLDHADQELFHLQKKPATAPTKDLIAGFFISFLFVPRKIIA